MAKTKEIIYDLEFTAKEVEMLLGGVNITLSVLDNFGVENIDTDDRATLIRLRNKLKTINYYADRSK